MIENAEQFQQAIQQMGRMRRILESYRADVQPKKPRDFAVFAGAPLDERCKLRAGIDQYSGTRCRVLGNNYKVPGKQAPEQFWEKGKHG
jgi:hypothetical protein